MNEKMHSSLSVEFWITHNATIQVAKTPVLSCVHFQSVLHCDHNPPTLQRDRQTDVMLVALARYNRQIAVCCAKNLNKESPLKTVNLIFSKIRYKIAITKFDKQ